MNNLYLCRFSALSKRIIDRIFSGCVTRGQRKTQHDEKLSYCEFVWFLLSEEDKRHPTAIEYWFRCMDLDGDGYISMYELEYFYEEQMHRLEMIGIETLPFEVSTVYKLTYKTFLCIGYDVTGLFVSNVRHGETSNTWENCFE